MVAFTVKQIEVKTSLTSRCTPRSSVRGRCVTVTPQCQKHASDFGYVGLAERCIAHWAAKPNFPSSMLS